MILFPNAKINLGLRVIGKRPDGYHNLETVFFPVPIFDVLEIVTSKQDPAREKKESSETIKNPCHRFQLPGGNLVRYSKSGTVIPGEYGNDLVIQAFELFDKQFGIQHDLVVHLHKNIPIGAGLGGGSADAVFALKGINHLLGKPASGSEMHEMAQVLGSDCPFFLFNQPAIGTGRGEVLESLELNLKGSFLVILKPEIHISTATAFAGIRFSESPLPLKEIVQWHPSMWTDKLSNDFERTIFQLHPEIEKLKNILTDRGATYTSMSGSGSSVFGIFTENPGLFQLPDGVRIFSAPL